MLLSRPLTLCLGIAIVLPQAGCAGFTNSEEISPGRYRIEHAYGGKRGYTEAVDKLTQRAQGLCTGGEYYKVNDYETSASGPRRIVWEISCKEVPEAFRRIQRPSRSDGL